MPLRNPTGNAETNARKMHPIERLAYHSKYRACCQAKSPDTCRDLSEMAPATAPRNSARKAQGDPGGLAESPIFLKVR